jgi:hypothetical protein
MFNALVQVLMHLLMEIIAQLFFLGNGHLLFCIIGVTILLSPPASRECLLNTLILCTKYFY